MKHLLLGAFGLWLCGAAIAGAQQGTADLRGRVIDSQQAGMPGVALLVRNPLSGLFRETTSGADGTFSSAPGFLACITSKRRSRASRPTNGRMSARKKVSSLLSARSGAPFSLIDSRFDADQNRLTANEYLPADTYSGSGADAVTIDDAGGRNGARSSSYMTLDLRAGYHLRLSGGRTFDAFLDVFNATNRANFLTPGGDRRTAATFLRVLAIEGAPRTAQINVGLGF